MNGCAEPWPDGKGQGEGESRKHWQEPGQQAWALHCHLVVVLGQAEGGGGQALIPWEVKSAVRPGCILSHKCSSHTHSSRRRIIIDRLKLRSCENGWVTKITKKLLCSGLGHTQVHTHWCSEAVMLPAGTGRGCHASLSAFQRLHGGRGLGRRGGPGSGAASTDGCFWRCVLTMRNPFT